VAACASCGAENREGVKFCGECGSALASACAACGTPNEPGRKFCGECGAPLRAVAAPELAQATPAIAERRMVSVLFADLVGFTSLAELRDAEEVRELLSRYFDLCRRLVELYGGVVEKFIGDAVMAVWGTPVAQEDDAERAVRTALDVIVAVTALGDEVGAPDLRARVGVLTGEAAVNIGAAGQGMVAGDLVNTAARIQAAAEPGTVIVGDSTRRASERAIAYEHVGERELRGKSAPVALYRAVRVTAARGGALRSEGLEAPFVGRERDLRLVKELFHASAEQSRAQLVQITGIAGIGKSRLAWEFFKYLDGLADSIRWHRGRCLAYGEGVAYWALAEMVRTRARILEGEDPDVARQKLAESLAEHVPDADERAWIAPRLANLLGLEERVDSERQDLFAAWRLFFERLADRQPVVLVFEDLQWADQALLAFLEYLLEWSSAQRLYVLALSRPELADRQPEFARGVRNSTSLALEPLSDDQMRTLLDGYVPGLSVELKRQVLERAQGVPLYAVETVRMLIDRGLLVEDGPIYRPAAEIGSLEIPESLHALMAARLDGLPSEERQLVQGACVLGKSFSKQALAVLAGRPEVELEPLLAGLVRKEVLSLQADPRQPERGQYTFLQELLRQVAYETLSKRDRRARHLAAVAALEQTFAAVTQDVPEVIAAHLLAAADALPDDPATPEIRLRARAALVQAGERAAGLAAPEEARRYLDQAAALADGDPSLQAELLQRAGQLALLAGSTAEARDRLEEAIRLHEQAGDTLAAARGGVALAEVAFRDVQLDEAVRMLESVLPALEQARAGADVAAALGQLGRMQMLRSVPGAAQTLERALEAAEELALDEVLVNALISRALVLVYHGRHVEGRLLLEGALARARLVGLHAAWERGANNLAILFQDADEYAAAVALLAELEARARQLGSREVLAVARFSPILGLTELGHWDDVLVRLAEAEELRASRWASSEVVNAVRPLCEQGRIEAAEALLRDEEWQRDAEQPDTVADFTAVEARLLRAQERPEEALAAARRGLGLQKDLAATSSWVKRCFVEAFEAAVELGDLHAAEGVLAQIESLKAGELTPYLIGHRARFHARLDARGGNHEHVERNLRSAEIVFADRGLVFHQAVTQLDLAEWLLGRERADDAQRLLTEARATFERLEASPWLERVDSAWREIPAAAPA
jgi:class 3 adenylate cyclase